MRVSHAASQKEEQILSLSEARKNKININWNETEIRRPQKLGITVLENISLKELVPYIDWTPFFMTWRLRGAYPQIFEDKKMGKEAKKLFDEAQILLNHIIQDKCLIR